MKLDMLHDTDQTDTKGRMPQNLILPANFLWPKNGVLFNLYGIERLDHICHTTLWYTAEKKVAARCHTFNNKMQLVMVTIGSQSEINGSKKKNTQY